jgi:uncharacterized protein YjbJ (UPF0337 family)
MLWRLSHVTDDGRSNPMDGDEIRNKDDAKGRVKEAAGDLTGDKDLEREGKVDQAGGKAKDGIERLTDKVKDVLHRD